MSTKIDRFEILYMFIFLIRISFHYKYICSKLLGCTFEATRLLYETILNCMKYYTISSHFPSCINATNYHSTDGFLDLRCPQIFFKPFKRHGTQFAWVNYLNVYPHKLVLLPKSLLFFHFNLLPLILIKSFFLFHAISMIPPSSPHSRDSFPCFVISLQKLELMYNIQ